MAGKLGRLRSRAMLAIASFIVHYPDEEATSRDDEAVADRRALRRQSKSGHVIVFGKH